MELVKGSRFTVFWTEDAVEVISHPSFDFLYGN